MSWVDILPCLLFFFFNDTPTPEIAPLPLHDPLPIGRGPPMAAVPGKKELETLVTWGLAGRCSLQSSSTDRKSTRLNSSHQIISYAVFCLKKKSGSHSHHLRERAHLPHARVP